MADAIEQFFEYQDANLGLAVKTLFWLRAIGISTIVMAAALAFDVLRNAVYEFLDRRERY